MSSTTQPIIGEDVALSTREVLIQVVFLSLVMTIVPMLPFYFLWGADRMWAGVFNPVVIPAVLIMVLVHEVIHAISWKFAGKLRWKDISFGFMFKTLSPYCHANAPMPAKAYRIGTVMPGIVLGLLPFVVGLLIGDGVWAFLGAMLIGGAAGDVYVLWIIRTVPENRLVIDHPSKVGCILLPA